MEPKEVVSLFDDVPAGTTVSESYEVPADCTIDGIWCRNYVGHGFDLRYAFYRIDAQGRQHPLLEHLGKSYLTGDDDTHDLAIRVPVKEGEKIRVDAINNETEYMYHASARIHLEYEGGLVSGILAALGVS